MAGEKPGLGKAISMEELAKVDYTVLPNGYGLPEGSGNAENGAVVYAQNCLACHGEDGTDGLNDRLVGGLGSLTTDKPVKTVGSYWPYATTLFDYVRRAMPYQAPGSLTNNQVYAVTAYILFLNGIVEEDAQLNAQTLPNVKMPNRDNVVWDYQPE
ncbi:MAG: cytochrome c [Gammaproteobacteria bacterium]|nr:MAG: cytochrome c [Gammaproteobacteria bacterium]RLA36412.1 MAG: cytochrome c [Gammaproteobacteria bacterium]